MYDVPFLFPTSGERVLDIHTYLRGWPSSPTCTSLINSTVERNRGPYPSATPRYQEGGNWPVMQGPHQPSGSRALAESEQHQILGSEASKTWSENTETGLEGLWWFG